MANDVGEIEVTSDTFEDIVAAAYERVQDAAVFCIESETTEHGFKDEAIESLKDLIAVCEASLKLIGEMNA